jgi:hypothetical protein
MSISSDFFFPESGKNIFICLSTFAIKFSEVAVKFSGILITSFKLLIIFSLVLISFDNSSINLSYLILSNKY